MCAVSNIGDSYKQTFPDRWPNVSYPFPNQTVVVSGVSQEEFDKLKKEVEQLKILLKAAKKFDEATGQPDCEMDEKVKFIIQLAEFVGVDLDKLFK